MNKEKLLSLLKKLTEGKLDEQESSELTKELNKAENEQTIYEFMESSWNADQFEQSRSFDGFRSERLYQKITQLPRFNKSVKTARLLAMKMFYRIAASVVIISMLTLAGYHVLSLRKRNELAMIEYRALPGEIVQKKLPDGSSVWLNANSSIRFSSDFSGENRDVFLKGEAYFDVVHRSNQPFIVHTGTINTKVLGTAFDIDSYDNNAIKVTVARGKVRVADADVELALLTKRKQVAYNLITKRKSEATVEPADITSWISGELIFNNVTVSEATQTIARRYDVSFIFADPTLKTSRFVISFKKTSTLNEVLDVLAKLNHFSYSKINNTITINTER